MKKLNDYTEEELENMDPFEYWDLSTQHEREKAFDKMESVFPNTETIFNLLDSYKKYCIKFGRPYDEAHVYNDQNLYWKEYTLVIDKENKIRIQNFWKRDEGIDLRGKI